VGLDEVAVKEALEGNAYADAVRKDEAQARAFGISAVPFFVVDRTYGVGGAQPADLLLEVLEKAWARPRPLTIATAPDAAACDDSGCAI
jgi:predicted DsbA family dithiol-disulfide isomerase